MRTLLIISIAVWCLAPTGVALAASCTSPPPTPAPPLGCRALQPTCICDARGDCHWEFLCVRE